MGFIINNVNWVFLDAVGFTAKLRVKVNYQSLKGNMRVSVAIP